MKTFSDSDAAGITNSKLVFEAGQFFLLLSIAWFSFHETFRDFNLHDDFWFIVFSGVVMVAAIRFVFFRVERSEIVFTGDSFELYRSSRGEPQLIYKNIPKVEMKSCHFERKPKLGDVLTVTLKNGFLFEINNQYFNIGALSGRTIFSFLREQMAETNCKISMH